MLMILMFFFIEVKLKIVQMLWKVENIFDFSCKRNFTGMKPFFQKKEILQKDSSTLLKEINCF